MNQSDEPPVGYLSHQELTALVQQWARDYPAFVRLRSLAKTLEGRDVWLLELGVEPDRARPAVWVDGNMHAAELLGSSIALNIARELIEFHRSGAVASIGPAHRSNAVRDGLFYIVPRVSPDGAEEVLKSGRITRSAPRDRRDHADAPFWRRQDLDGDGCVRQMRMAHPAGGFVAHPELPQVLVPREVDDVGPYYKVFPEGIIESFGGTLVPYPSTTSDNDADFNRDFRTTQVAGPVTSAVNPETQAILEFAQQTPHIAVWLNLHTFGGVFIRPPFQETAGLPAPDQAAYDAIARMFERASGMKTICAVDEMTPVKSKPMLGTLASWAHAERGCLAWAVELWDLFGAVGIPDLLPFYQSYGARPRDEVARLAAWDSAHNAGRAYAAWKPYDHPQLGPVEIGGLSPLWGFLNPPTAEIAKVAAAMYQVTTTAAGLLPQLRLAITQHSVARARTVVRLRVANDGWLSTSVVEPGAAQDWAQPLRATIRESGCRLIEGHRDAEVGHLPGWGNVIDPDDRGPFFQRSSGIADAQIEWLVEGAGTFEVEVGSPRLGWRTLRVSVPDQ